MIAPESINIASLPSLALTERKRLPNVVACYLVLEDETVIYVGKSKNLVLRWLNHDKLKNFKDRDSEVKIAWIEVSESSLLASIEKALIRYFRPLLNQHLFKEVKSKTLKNTKTERDKLKKVRKTEIIQVLVKPEDKAAFDAWCKANSTTMSEVLRQEMTPYVLKGQELSKKPAL